MNENITLYQRWLASFLNLFFDLLYHQFAWSYDLVAWIVSLGMWNTWLQTALPFLSGPNVLEIGHGPGHLQLPLHHKGIFTAGLDRSPQMGRIASKRLRKSNLTPQLVNANSQHLPFPKESFNQIAATFPTEFIIHPDTIREIHRILKPNGKAIIIPSAEITGRTPWHAFAAWLFQVTGQSGKTTDNLYQKGISKFQQAGLHVRQRSVKYSNSRVQVIIATK